MPGQPADDTDRLRAGAAAFVRSRLVPAAACLFLVAGCGTLPAETANPDGPKTVCREEMTGSNLPRCKRGDNTVTTSREDIERSGAAPGGGAPPSSSATGRRPGL